MGKKILRAVGAIMLVVITILGASHPQLITSAEAAPGDVIDCTTVYNISNSPGYNSIDPMLLADKSGDVHLFWAERISGQLDAASQIPDALMYSKWDGNDWSAPIDIFLSPSDIPLKRIGSIRGVVDEQNTIHLIWMGPDNTFYYSSNNASQAALAGKWRSPELLASDQAGTQYSIDIAYEAPRTLHVIYGVDPGYLRNHSVSYLRSNDNGSTWTQPEIVYTVPLLDRGVSNLRLLVDAPDRIYATWTEWDESGNGQAIYFSRTGKGGKSWDEPILLDERLGIEYERDWTTLAKVGEDELIAFWEGGFRAYRQAQYSHDGGQSWSEPIDTLDWLISDNGFAEFVRDSSDRLHLFTINRVREGNPDRSPGTGGSTNGLWHTIWEGGTQWRQPEMVGNPRGGNFVTVAISGGNQFFAASFNYVRLEIDVVRCQIEGAPSIKMEPLALTDNETSLALTQESELAEAPKVDETNSTFEFDLRRPSNPQSDLGTTLGLALIAPLLMIVSTFLIFTWYRRRSI